MASGTLRRRRGRPKRKNPGTNRALRCLGKLAIALLLQCWIALLLLGPFVAVLVLVLPLCLSVSLSVWRCSLFCDAPHGCNEVAMLCTLVSGVAMDGRACKFSAAMLGLHVFTACAIALGRRRIALGGVGCLAASAVWQTWTRER